MLACFALEEVRLVSGPPQAVATKEPARGPGTIDRALRVFGDVRAGEGGTVLLMAFNVAILLVAYYILKTVREPLILLAGGAELKSYAAAAQALTLIGYVPLYGWVAARMPRQRFLAAVVLFFVGCIEVFVLGGRLAVPHLGFAFYVWVGIFSLTTIAQFWSFANEVFTRDEGDRLFPLIAVGSTAGAPLGAALAETLFARGVGPFRMMQLAAAILVLHLVLYRVLARRLRGAAKPRAQAPIDPGNGFALVLKSRYLRLIAALLVLLNLANTVGEFILARAVVTAADARAAALDGFNKGAFIGGFYADYFFWVNVLTILIQAFLVSRIVKRLGMAGVVLALPVVAFGAYGVAAAGAGLATLRILKTAENSTDYSLMNTAKQMLWLPTTRVEKYKAKQAVDTFFVRTGDLLAALVVFLGTRVVRMDVPGFAWANIAVVVASFFVGLVLLRENRRLAASPEFSKA
jgi:AAA family ATP:ADP antiporter